MMRKLAIASATALILVFGQQGLAQDTPAAAKTTDRKSVV